jgi:hypothetical protein
MSILFLSVLLCVGPTPVQRALVSHAIVTFDCDNLSAPSIVFTTPCRWAFANFDHLLSVEACKPTSTAQQVFLNDPGSVPAVNRSQPWTAPYVQGLLMEMGFVVHEEFKWEGQCAVVATGMWVDGADMEQNKHQKGASVNLVVVRVSCSCFQHCLDMHLFTAAHLPCT